jgi:hypothetical protein
MPVQRGKDSKGPYYSWGTTGAKYRYTPGDTASRKKAEKKAKQQGKAIKIMQRKNNG